MRFSEGIDGKGVERVRVSVKSLEGVIAKAKQALKYEGITLRSVVCELYWETQSSVVENPGNLLVGKVRDFQTEGAEEDGPGRRQLNVMKAMKAVRSLFEEVHEDTTVYSGGTHTNANGTTDDHGVMVCPDHSVRQAWKVDRRGSSLRVVRDLVCVDACR